MSQDPLSGPELDEVEARIDTWLSRELESSPILVDVTRDDGDLRRWYVRLAGEERDFTAIWLTLGQRTLKYESYIWPAPEDNRADVYERLLRINYKLVGAQFGIGPEDALFLTGELPISALDDDELDRIVGSVFAYTEEYFRPILRLAFSSHFG